MLLNLLVYIIIFMNKKIKNKYYKISLKKALKKQNVIKNKEEKNNFELLNNIMKDNSFADIYQVEDKNFISFDISLLKLKSHNYNKLENDDHQLLLEFSKFLIDHNKYPIFITKYNEGILISKNTNLSLKMIKLKDIDSFVESIKVKTKKQNDLK